MIERIFVFLTFPGVKRSQRQLNGRLISGVLLQLFSPAQSCGVRLRLCPELAGMLISRNACGFGRRGRQAGFFTLPPVLSTFAGRYRMSDEFKRHAAERAMDEIRDGMKVGIGTGSTAEHFVRALGAAVRAGLKVTGVPTSERTAALAREEGIPLSTLEEMPALDVTVDGADEIDPDMALIKGGGGALLREKIVAAASGRMVVIADSGKLVQRLGKFPLPVEVVPFGLGATRIAVEAVLARHGLQGEVSLRGGADHPFVTDGGHYILDAALGAIPDAARLAVDLNLIPGVVETGLFIGLAAKAYVAGPSGVEVITKD
jgi:ribose 5-phosphate isomerase A